jgi:aminoglycoside 6'-N-acetyltransferase I
MTHAFVVRPATREDAAAWLRMRQELWPEYGESYHPQEVSQYFDGKLEMPLQVLIATDAAGNPLGFAELSIRAYAEGCSTNRVAYLEGWYVVPEARRGGVGRALVEAAERWGAARGCTEFASDSLLDNTVSAAAHRALGFEEVEQIRCYRKSLPGRR